VGNKRTTQNGFQKKKVTIMRRKSGSSAAKKSLHKKDGDD
jgi:hypothetical protein